MYYNFARVHQTLRVTPAMEACISDHVWSVEEIVGLLEKKGGGACGQRHDGSFFTSSYSLLFWWCSCYRSGWGLGLSFTPRQA